MGKIIDHSKEWDEREENMDKHKMYRGNSVIQPRNERGPCRHGRTRTELLEKIGRKQYFLIVCAYRSCQKWLAIDFYFVKEDKK